MRLSHRTSGWLHERCQPLKQGLLEFRAATAGGTWRLPIQARQSRGPATLIDLFKDRAGRLSIAADIDWLATRNGFSTAWRRVGVFVDLLAASEIPAGHWQADLADWVRPAGPVLGFCSNHSDTLLVPDRGFFKTRGYAQQRRLAARCPNWEHRRAAVVWRGGPNGHGLQATPEMDWRDERLLQRVRLCLLGRALAARKPGGLLVDLRLASVCEYDPAEAAAVRAAGIVGPRVSPQRWLHDRFAINIDGHANAFTNFYTRLLFGCCVLKVASPRQFRQWYYDRLAPWVHYIPVAEDLTDLPERLAWCTEHPRDCQQIAQAGQQVVLGMTHAGERQQAIASLCSTEQRPLRIAA